jgi:dienelactone hydrolase
MSSAGSGGLMGPGLTLCDSFIVTGDPTAATGATWTYQSTDEGVEYSLEGVLFSPPGEGPFPAVEIHHGKDGSIKNYTPSVARVMVTWGLVAIGTQYTHAPDADDEGNLPDGPDGASNENIERARKTYDLLDCLGTVDMTRVATHGHSMGAFINAQLVGTYPGLFAVASHTAGGTSAGPNATREDAAEQIVTPYSIHHGDIDMTVGIVQDQALSDILLANGVDYEFFTYVGYDHPDIPLDETMFERVRTWYEAHGVLTPN